MVNEFTLQWARDNPGGQGRRRFNRVADLLTPISHVTTDTYEAGVESALEALAGRIHTGFDDAGEPTYAYFTDE